MADVSPLAQPRRRKPVTYGKSSRNVNAWSLDSLKEDELNLPVPKTVAESNTKLKEAYAVSKSETKTTGTLKPIKRREKKQDAWDVPSSGDESEEPLPRKTPPKLTAGRRHAVAPAKHVQTEEKLAPWEKRKAAESQSEQEERSRRKRYMPLSSETQLMSELTYSLQHGQGSKSAASPQKAVRLIEPDQHVTATPAESSSPAPTSAAARLRAKKLLSTSVSAPKVDEIASQKRPGQDTATAIQSPRKKLKAMDSPKEERSDVDMDDARAECEHPQVLIQPSTDSMDVYDLPDSSADESTRSRSSRLKAPTPKAGGKPRRGKLMTYSRSTPRKMDSAPARLSDMLSNDMDTTTDATSPSAANSPPTTPPKSSRVATPETAFKHSGTMTPKQARLWDQLLESDTSATTPQVLAIQDLTLNSRRIARTTNGVSKSLVKSSSDVGPRRRTKLVDRLKASAPSTDGDLSDESEDDSPRTDVEMAEQEVVEPAEPISSQQSQSQSQSQSQRIVGAKVTYASRTRSHLPEDNFEDGLMFSLTSETPQKGPVSRQISAKSNAMSQKSAFDVDESDDDEQTGRIRTIHELRAGGVNQRFMNDIGGLLQDIADHNSSARSRRRSALIELASKVADTAFAEKFFRQGYEQQLLVELNAARDDVADFTLASVFATMLSHEVPDHIAPSFRDAGVLTWLVGMLQVRIDPVKMAKDRKNNMSKSAQRSFAGFVDALKECELLWGEKKPAGITSRTIALKIFDKLIGRLRRSGDRSELVDGDDLRQLMPDDGDALGDNELATNLTHSISTLEALSTTALSLSWSHDVVDRVRAVLTSPRLGDVKAQHLLFLTMRLCLNLTNENARNCKVLSKPPTVVVLLQAMTDGFANLHADVSDEQRTINLDLLVLSMGILINLSEHNDSAREQATTSEASPLLSSLVDVFQVGQQRLIEAESVEQGATNVAYGYLAVVLANLCRNREAKAFIASKLPGKNLSALVEALAEFVLQHQKVDTIALEGEEGMEVWRAFTEKLKGVLRRVQAEAEAETD